MEQVFEANEKKFYDMGMIPDPPSKKYALNIDYDPSEEEKFDENKHLGKIGLKKTTLNFPIQLLKNPIISEFSKETQ